MSEFNPSQSHQQELITIPDHLRPQPAIEQTADMTLLTIPDHLRAINPTLERDIWAGNLALDPRHRVPDLDVTDRMNANTVQKGGEAIKAKLEAVEFDGDENTAELFKYLPPTSGLSIDGQKFYLSSAVSEGPRAICVGYVELKTGQVAPRLFYKSSSQGEWRVSPRTETRVDDEGKTKRYYSKGETMEFGYARETQLHDDLSAALEKVGENATAWNTESIHWLMDHFNKKKLGSGFTYEDEAFEVKIWPATSEVYGLKPGHGFETPDGRPAREIFANATFPASRTPDFERPIKTTTSEHPVLGTVTTEKYVSQDEALVWNISHDAKGRVWISGVVGMGETKPSTYGTSDEVVSVGLLDNKPLEYRSQIEGLVADKDYVDVPGAPGYVDITPLLDNLPLIRHYRMARNIQRVA